jgi:rhodanese-related sulfurtransferase
VTYRFAAGVSGGSQFDRVFILPDIPFEIAPSAVKSRLEAGETLRLIDVREPAEYPFAKIEGAELIPMRSMPQVLQDLEESDGCLIVFCHHGVRSLSVVEWLRRQGVENCQSMSGGIDLWSRQIDPTVPRY